MASRPRPSSAPGSGRGRAGRRPGRSAGKTPSTPASRRTTRTTSASIPEPPAPRSKLTGRAAILLLVVAVLGVSYASSTRAWLNQRSEINALHAEITARKSAVADLEQQTRRWHDDEFVKSEARRRFGWVMPGEVGYRVIDDNGEILSDGTNDLSEPIGPAVTAEQQWWEDAWGSVVEAGAEPDTSDEPTAPVRKPADRIGTTPNGHDKQGSR